MMNLTINDFEGPLDLLLHLIRINKMDIYEINIESITKEYMNFINETKEKSIDVASEYLVMASELIHLKSKLLIHRDDVCEDDEEYEINSESDLQNKLLEYQKIKDLTDDFRSLEYNRSQVYTKIPSNLKEYKTITPLSGNVSLDDLIIAFESFLEREKLKKPINTRITNKEYSVTERTNKIRNILKTKHKINFIELFDNLTKPYVVVTFLSILEMTKNNEVKLIQENNYSNIMIESVK